MRPSTEGPTAAHFCLVADTVVGRVCVKLFQSCCKNIFFFSHTPEGLRAQLRSPADVCHVMPMCDACVRCSSPGTARCYTLNLSWHRDQYVIQNLKPADAKGPRASSSWIKSHEDEP